MRDLMHLPVWPFISILGYPALTIVVLELARRLALRAPFVSGILRQVAYVLLPTGGIWLILRVLAELPADDWAVRTAETAFALTGLYLLLRVAQALLMSLVDEQMRAPKLLLDILRIGLSLVWGSVVVSRIWNVNLGSLLAAMGVGSIALAFALQEFLGNLLSGLGLLSAHKFSIGDWIMLDGKAAEVVEMDWRTVTLVTAGGNRVVVANSTLAKGNLTIAARAREKASATVPLALGVDIPPEQVRDAVIEAGRAMPNLAEPEGARYRRGDLLLTAGAPAPDSFLVVAGRLAVTVPTGKGEIRLELVPPGQLMVLQEMLAGGSSPVRVVADLDTDVLAIPAQALVDAMDRSRVVARDISAVTEAWLQAILPLNRGLRVVA